MPNKKEQMLAKVKSAIPAYQKYLAALYWPAKLLTSSKFDELAREIIELEEKIKKTTLDYYKKPLDLSVFSKEEIPDDLASWRRLEHMRQTVRTALKEKWTEQQLNATLVTQWMIFASLGIQLPGIPEYHPRNLHHAITKDTLHTLEFWRPNGNKVCIACNNESGYTTVTKPNGEFVSMSANKIYTWTLHRNQDGFDITVYSDFLMPEVHRLAQYKQYKNGQVEYSYKAPELLTADELFLSGQAKFPGFDQSNKKHVELRKEWEEYARSKRVKIVAAEFGTHISNKAKREFLTAQHDWEVKKKRWEKGGRKGPEPQKPDPKPIAYVKFDNGYEELRFQNGYRLYREKLRTYQGHDVFLVREVDKTFSTRLEYLQKENGTVWSGSKWTSLQEAMKKSRFYDPTKNLAFSLYNNFIYADQIGPKHAPIYAWEDCNVCKQVNVDNFEKILASRLSNANKDNEYAGTAPVTKMKVSVYAKSAQLTGFQPSNKDQQEMKARWEGLARDQKAKIVEMVFGESAPTKAKRQFLTAQHDWKVEKERWEKGGRMGPEPQKPDPKPIAYVKFDNGYEELRFQNGYYLSRQKRTRINDCDVFYVEEKKDGKTRLQYLQKDPDGAVWDGWKWVTLDDAMKRAQRFTPELDPSGGLGVESVYDSRYITPLQPKHAPTYSRGDWHYNKMANMVNYYKDWAAKTGHTTHFDFKMDNVKSLSNAPYMWRDINGKNVTAEKEISPQGKDATITLGKNQMTFGLQQNGWCHTVVRNDTIKLEYYVKPGGDQDCIKGVYIQKGKGQAVRCEKDTLFVEDTYTGRKVVVEIRNVDIWRGLVGFQFAEEGGDAYVLLRPGATLIDPKDCIAYPVENTSPTSRFRLIDAGKDSISELVAKQLTQRFNSENDAEVLKYSKAYLANKALQKTLAAPMHGLQPGDQTSYPYKDGFHSMH